jgi:hypothetical protein
MATPRLRQTGLAVLGDLPWGSHCCHLFQTRGDLLETLIPFFKAGLEGRELCLWVIHAPLTEAVARELSVPPSVLRTHTFRTRTNGDRARPRQHYVEGNDAMPSRMLSMTMVLESHNHLLRLTIRERGGAGGRRPNGASSVSTSGVGTAGRSRHDCSAPRGSSGRVSRS